MKLKRLGKYKMKIILAVVTLLFLACKEKEAPVQENFNVDSYFEKANNLVRTLCDNSFALLEYYLSLPSNFVNAIDEDQNREMALLQNMELIRRRNS